MNAIPADIDAIARWSYEHGRDPIEYAETTVVQIHLDVYLTIVTGRAENPASFPGYTLELTPEALARRIIGGLLDAGWTSPALGDVRIAEWALIEYSLGISPIGYAECLIAGVFACHLDLVQRFTGGGLEVALQVTGEMSLASISRFIVRVLIDAGWAPPEVTP